MGTYSFSVPQCRTFQQTTPSSEWIVDYIYNIVPIIEVAVHVNGQLVKIIPAQIEKLSSHSVKIYFSSPYTGEVRIVG